MTVDIEKIINKVNVFLGEEDYNKAEKLLLYWIDESLHTNNKKLYITLLNELTGVYRKSFNNAKGINSIKELLSFIKKEGYKDELSIGTIYLNSATSLSSFLEYDLALDCFKKAKVIFDIHLDKNSLEFSGYYNNLGTYYDNISNYEKAIDSYNKALDILLINLNSDKLLIAITYSNIVDSLNNLEEENFSLIENYLFKCYDILINYKNKDSYYSYVVRSIATVMDYNGYFLQKKELLRLANN